MRLWSAGWTNGEPMPARFAAGRLNADGSIGFGDNLSPPLAWNDLPAGTRSLALVCHDFDGPGRPEALGRADGEVPDDLPRVDFFHWVLVDIPPHCAGFAEGQWSRGFCPRGKAGPAAPDGMRQGLNDYTSRFARDPQLAGRYFGYDGPYPPPNDLLVHHCVFTLYALSVDRLAVAGDFNGAAVREAVAGQVLVAATLSGTYTLNRRLVWASGG